MSTFPQKTKITFGCPLALEDYNVSNLKRKKEKKINRILVWKCCFWLAGVGWFQPYLKLSFHAWRTQPHPREMEPTFVHLALYAMVRTRWSKQLSLWEFLLPLSFYSTAWRLPTDFRNPRTNQVSNSWSTDVGILPASSPALGTESLYRLSTLLEPKRQGPQCEWEYSLASVDSNLFSKRT